MDAGGPRFLGDTRNQFLDLLAHDHHHVGKLVDYHYDHRQRFEFRCFVFHAFAAVQRIGQRRAGLGCIFHLAVEARQVAHTHGGHQLVATLHLGNTPTQRVGGFFHVGHYRCEQVRNALVDRQLEHFRVNHDQPNLGRRCLEQDAQQHGVDADRFTRASGTRHQQVGHLGQISHHRVPADVVPQRKGYWRLGLIEFAGFQHL